MFYYEEFEWQGKRSLLLFLYIHWLYWIEKNIEIHFQNIILQDHFICQIDVQVWHVFIILWVKRGRETSCSDLGFFFFVFLLGRVVLLYLLWYKKIYYWVCILFFCCPLLNFATICHTYDRLNSGSKLKQPKGWMIQCQKVPWSFGEEFQHWSVHNSKPEILKQNLY